MNIFRSSLNNEDEWHQHEGVIHRKTEDGNRYRLPKAYLNVQFLREMEHNPVRMRSGGSTFRWDLSIRRHYRELKERVCIENVCDHLIQSGVLHTYDMENIQCKWYPRHARVDKLLQILLQRRDESFFSDFLRALENTGCQDLSKKLESTNGLTKKPYIRGWSSKDILDVWPRIVEFLKDELLPEYIIDYFMQENTITVDDYEEIFRCMGTRRKMAETLLEKIKENLPEAFFVLLYALEKEDKINKIGVDVLEKIVKSAKEQKGNLDNSRNDQPGVGVYLVTANETASPVTAPLSPQPKYTLELNLKKDGKPVQTIEAEIDKYMNNTDATCLLRDFLQQTGCEITKSELGCVVVHLRPHSRHAYKKLSEFCKKGGMNIFVLNLLREKDIISSIPEGELSIDVKVLYHEDETEIEGAEKPQTDTMQMIKDNWCFLCEELDVQTLTGDFVATKIFNDYEKTEIKRRLARHRHEAADYFLQCLIKKGARGIEAFMTALKKNTTTKIIDRLQNSDPKYRNQEVIKENLLCHYDLFVDEIDPTQFEDTFVDRKIMNKEFFIKLEEKKARRRVRADTFLTEVLNKGSKALFAFVDVMREMGCIELVDKLTAVEDIADSLKSQCKDGSTEYVDLEVSNSPTREGLVWTCCLKMDVRRILIDNKNEISGGCIKAEQVFSTIQPLDEIDDGIVEAENESSVPLRVKQDMSVSCRQPESSCARSSQSELERCLTYPTIRLSDKANTNQPSLLSSAARQVKDSGIDIRDSKEVL